MLPRIIQFVPSAVCLSCNGCCRFKEEASTWRPKITAEEIHTGAKRGLAEEIFSKVVEPKTRFIKTTPCSDGHCCSFFNRADNTCRVYQNRPFECQLYPFILTKHDKGIALAVHHLCPFIQEKYQTAEYIQYVNYLKEFFHREEVLAFLSRNDALVGDYSDYENEIEFLFEIEPVGSIESIGSIESVGSRLKGLNDYSALLEKKSIIEGFLRQGKCELSSHAFVNIFLWKDFFDFIIEEIDGNLCVFAENEVGIFLYLPPLGETISPTAVAECFRRMKAVNKANGVSRIENIPQDMLGQFPEGRFSRVKKYDEYVYHREDIARLRGNDYKSQRNSCNYFTEHYCYEYLPFEASMTGECLELYTKWAEQRSETQRDEIYRQMLEENHQVHRTALENFRELGLVGRVVLVDGQIKGYTFGYPLNDETFCVLLEITDLSLSGTSVFIFREFCRDDSLKNFRWINAMDDFGIENVRRTKLSFRPSRVIPAYVITVRT